MKILGLLKKKIILKKKQSERVKFAEMQYNIIDYEIFYKPSKLYIKFIFKKSIIYEYNLIFLITVAMYIILHLYDTVTNTIGKTFNV